MSENADGEFEGIKDYHVPAEYFVESGGPAIPCEGWAVNDRPNQFLSRPESILESFRVAHGYFTAARQATE